LGFLVNSSFCEMNTGLTPYNKGHVKKLTDIKFILKFPALYGTQKFITVFIKVCQWTLITPFYLLTTDCVQYMFSVGCGIPIPESVHVNFTNPAVFLVFLLVCLS
jgi:hypothetical protein